MYVIVHPLWWDMRMTFEQTADLGGTRSVMRKASDYEPPDFWCDFLIEVPKIVYDVLVIDMGSRVIWL